MLQAIRTRAAAVTRFGTGATATRTFSTAAATSAAAAKPQSSIRARLLTLALAGGATLLMAAQMHSNSVSSAPARSGLDEKAFVPFKLAKDPSASLDLPVSSFILTKAPGPDGKDITRPYTPINQGDKGQLTLIVKVYPQGVMSKHIHSLKVGDTLEIKGPMPKLKYEANKYKKIGMAAGGTGISPMLQVIDTIIARPDDKTEVSLLFANTSPADILLKERLNAITAKHPNIKVTYLVDKADSQWQGPVGHVTAELLQQVMPRPSDDSFVYVCGPPGFMTAVSGTKNMKDYSQGELSGALKHLGFTEKNVFKF